MKKVVIFGTGDFARIAYVYLSKDSPYEVAAFTVHQAHIKEKTLLGIDIVPFEKILETHPPEQYEIFVAIGFKRVNKARAEIYELCKKMGYKFPTYINSKATHWGEIEVGENTFIFENNVIQPFVKIGNNVVVWSGNHIGHDSKIGDHCFIASHAVISGNVEIGAYCFVGVNTTFRDGVKVAPECVIGAGANILRDTRFQGVYAGANTEAMAKLSPELKSFQ